MKCEERDEKRRAILGAIKAVDLPPLEVDSDAYVSLMGSLKQHGCVNPVVMHGNEIISGRARKAICDSHGIKYEIIQVDELDEADLVSLQNDLIFVGRQIDIATKKEYAKHLLLATEGNLSNRAVQSKACVDKKIVQVIREELEASGEIPHTTIRYSRDGRSQDVTDKEERKTEDESAHEDDWQQDESGDESDDSEIEDVGETAEAEESDEWQDDEYPQLVCFDGPDPDEPPKQVYEVNGDKLTIVCRKVDRQEEHVYVLANGKALPKCYAHPTWVEAHSSLLAAVQGDQESLASDIEDLGEERQKLVSELKKVEAQIATAKKEKQRLDARLKKVESMAPPKGAQAETAEAIA